MSAQKQLVQCQKCGKFYYIYNTSALDDSYFLPDAWCPHCNEATAALYIGDEKDKYLFYNPNLDERYF